jgi:outer membrane protein OmpA-like peptidoglycan-associated protein
VQEPIFAKMKKTRTKPMSTILRGYLPVLALVAVCFGVPVVSWAQAAPSAAEMVEQLKAPAETSRPRTRSLRNLTVEAAGAPAVSGEAAAAVRPSLSLLIQFDFNSARVKPESQQALANLAQALQSQELAESKFAIEGHTDAKGRADYNLKLSQQRADAVRQFLSQRGVTESRLAAVGKGASEPANEADPLAAENRRVRVVNLN